MELRIFDRGHIWKRFNKSFIDVIDSIFWGYIYYFRLWRRSYFGRYCQQCLTLEERRTSWHHFPSATHLRESQTFNRRRIPTKFGWKRICWFDITFVVGVVNSISSWWCNETNISTRTAASEHQHRSARSIVIPTFSWWCNKISINSSATTAER